MTIRNLDSIEFTSFACFIYRRRIASPVCSFFLRENFFVPAFTANYAAKVLAQDNPIFCNTPVP